MPNVLAAPSSPNIAAHLDIPLRCYVYKSSSGPYYAECIDLNLSVRAKTQKKAVSSLKAAIHGYLQVAFEGETGNLIPRRAPLANRARYHFFRALLALHQTIKDFKAFVVKPETADTCYC